MTQQDPEVLKYNLLEKMMTEFVTEQGRPSSVATITNFEGEQSLFQSRLLGEAMMKEGESWPQREGRYFTPILNLHLSELPHLPRPLQGFAWLSLYIDVDSLVVGEYPRGENWELRLYKDLQGLAARSTPAPQERAESWTPRRLNWSSHQDVLSWYSEIQDEDLFPPPWEHIRTELPEHIYEWGPDGPYHLSQTKVGGWPSFKQYEEGASHPEHFVLQVCADYSPDRPGYDLCDNAITYLGFQNGTWRLETQTN